MTADNTSSEFALLTYAHHIVDTLANSAYQSSDYPLVTNFKSVRIQPIFIVAGAGYLISAFFYSQLRSGLLWSSSTYSSSDAHGVAVRRSGVIQHSLNFRLYGFSLRCVAR